MRELKPFVDLCWARSLTVLWGEGDDCGVDSDNNEQSLKTSRLLRERENFKSSSLRRNYGSLKAFLMSAFHSLPRHNSLVPTKPTSSPPNSARLAKVTHFDCLNAFVVLCTDTHRLTFASLGIITRSYNMRLRRGASWDINTILINWACSN